MNKILIKLYEKKLLESFGYIVNPRTTKEWNLLPEDARGVILVDGTLIMCTTEKIHSDIYDDLARKNILPMIEDMYDLSNTIEHFILIQQYGDTKHIYLAESYGHNEIEMEYNWDIKQIFKRAEQNNHSIKFIQMSWLKSQDYEKQLMKESIDEYGYVSYDEWSKDYDKFNNMDKHQFLRYVKQTLNPLPISEWKLKVKPDEWVDIDDALSIPGYNNEKRNFTVEYGKNGEPIARFGNMYLAEFYHFLKSIAENGLFYSPFIVKGKISEGNHRIQALKILSYDKVPLNYAK